MPMSPRPCRLVATAICSSIFAHSASTVKLVLAGNAEDYPALSMPAVDFARNALSALHKRVLKRGKKFEKLSVADRHRVRIAVKKMRYGVEFFGDLFPGKAQKKYSKTHGAAAGRPRSAQRCGHGRGDDR